MLGNKLHDMTISGMGDGWKATELQGLLDRVGSKNRLVRQAEGFVISTLYTGSANHLVKGPSRARMQRTTPTERWRAPSCAWRLRRLNVFGLQIHADALEYELLEADCW